MERDDRSRMTMAREHIPAFFTTEPVRAGGVTALGSDAAHHARVRRLESGDRVALTNGAGLWATGVLQVREREDYSVSVETAETRPAPPALHVCVPVADRDRMLWLAEKATELGITSWRAVHFRRSASVSPRGEGAAFHGRLRARMIAALEQSNGAWLPRIDPDVSVGDLTVEGDGPRIVLDARGEPLGRVVGGATGARLLIGPEGGIDGSEWDQLIAAGWQPARVGANTLRFETAALAAVAILLHG